MSTWLEIRRVDKTRSDVRVCERSKRRSKEWLDLVAFYAPPNTLAVWAWAQLQEPPLTWLEAKALVLAGSIEVAYHPHHKHRKTLPYVVLDASLIRTHGLVYAARAVWHRPPA